MFCNIIAARTDVRARWRHKKYKEAYDQLTDYAQSVISKNQIDSTWSNFEETYGGIESIEILGFYTENVETDSMNIFLYNYRTIFHCKKDSYSIDIFMSDKEFSRNIFGFIVRKENL